MGAQSLNHYTIIVRDLERTKDFYCDIVGLTVGERPPLNFPGYRLYCGGIPTVHLIGDRQGEEERRGEDALPEGESGPIHGARRFAGLHVG